MTHLIRLDQWFGAPVSAGFTNREGGVSEGNYESLNLGFHVSDREEDVQINRERVAAMLDVQKSDVLFGEQVHGNAVAVVTKDTPRRALYDAIAAVDGLVTTDRRIALGVLAADCVPLLFADAYAGVIGVAHAGWRGATSGIVSEVVRQMLGLFAKPERIRVAIGPAIRGCCYEVDAPVVRSARTAYEQMGKPMPVWRRSSNHIGAVMMDLPRICHDELRTLGVKEEHILDVSICTSCMPGFFSHRRDHGTTGRQAGLIRLRGV
ncbi:peptidoglycan editing factor PgeF [Sulfoacidibacillus thermotolerans]|nr:peptidoglycan editing factor PgeF [Sulfoacidibacillus thermotolerans]